MRATAFGMLFWIASMGFAADPDVAAKVEKLAESYAEWGPAPGTPGASLTFQEISRSGRKRVYHLVISGLPKEGTYALIGWPVTMSHPSVVQTPVFIDATGVLLCKKNGDVTSSDDTENLTIDNVRGEPARLGVIGIEDKTRGALGKSSLGKPLA